MFKKSLIVAQDLSCNIGERGLFSKINFSFDNEKTGLVGRNGIGKTTLIKLLLGKVEPSAGTVYINGKIGYLPQDFTFYANQSIASILGIEKKLKALKKIESGDFDEKDQEIIGADWDIVERTKALFAKLGLSHLEFSRKMESLSGGEVTRLMLAAVLLKKPDYIILDEPTNNLDIESRELLYKTLSSLHIGMLVISHDRNLLSLMDQIMELSTLGLKTYGGNYNYYHEQKLIEQEAKKRQLEDAQKFLKKTKKEAQKKKEFHQKKVSYGKKSRLSRSHPKMWYNAQKERSEKSKEKLTRTIDRQLQTAKKQVSQASKNVEDFDILKIKFAEVELPAKKIVADIKDLTFGYTVGSPVTKNFNLTVVGPERIAFVGPNGCGKSTLLKLILKKLQPTSGFVNIGVQRYAYLDQKVEILDHKKSILQNFQEMNPEINQADAYTILASFLFPGQTAMIKVENLSGGEKLRAALACCLMSKMPPKLVILDEPTNHLDLDSILCIEQLLKKYEGALIIVSHDETFLKNIGIEKKICL